MKALFSAGVFVYHPSITVDYSAVADPTHGGVYLRMEPTAGASPGTDYEVL